MKVQYDPETDTLTIRLREERIKESEEVRPGVIADYGYDGGVVRFEVLARRKSWKRPPRCSLQWGHKLSLSVRRGLWDTRVLTSEQSIVSYENGRATPDRLTRGRHGHYLDYARKMLAVYQSGVGRTRRELHQSVGNLLANEPDCDRRRVAAFCKLLDEAGEFDRDIRGKAAELRLRVFAMAAKYHPLVTTADGIFEHAEHEVKNRIAGELGRPWEQIDSELYADVMEFQRLRSFTGYGPDAAALLSRYNVAQLQACLYRAQRMSVAATTDFKTILRYAKLARLLHEVYRLGPSRYRIDLSGPASILQETRRYGVNFARFVPALLACRDWSLEAAVRTPWNGPAKLRLSSEDGYSSHLPPPVEFDSSVEESFAKKFGAEREGWRLAREGAILYEGQSAFVPDFVFRREDGTEVFLEIVGFWTPQYLAAKRETLARFRQHRILIAVAERSVREDAVIPPDVLVYKTALKVEPVLAALHKR